MAIIKVLKRKDGAALVTGVAVGLIVYAFVTAIVQDLSQRISAALTSSSYAGSGWEPYVLPTAIMILSLLALEVLIWIYVSLHDTIG